MIFNKTQLFLHNDIVKSTDSDAKDPIRDALGNYWLSKNNNVKFGEQKRAPFDIKFGPVRTMSTKQYPFTVDIQLLTLSADPQIFEPGSDCQDCWETYLYNSFDYKGYKGLDLNSSLSKYTGQPIVPGLAVLDVLLAGEGIAQRFPKRSSEEKISTTEKENLVVDYHSPGVIDVVLGTADIKLFRDTWYNLDIPINYDHIKDSSLPSTYFGNVEYQYNYHNIQYETMANQATVSLNGVDIPFTETRMMNLYLFSDKDETSQNFIKITDESGCNESLLKNRVMDTPYTDYIIPVDIYADVERLNDTAYVFPFYNKITLKTDPNNLFTTALEDTFFDTSFLRFISEVSPKDDLLFPNTHMITVQKTSGYANGNPKFITVVNDSYKTQYYDLNTWIEKYLFAQVDINSEFPEHYIIGEEKQSYSESVATYDISRANAKSLITALRSRVSEIVRKKNRSYDEILRNVESYHEILAYKISKFRTSDILAKLNQDNSGFLVNDVFNFDKQLDVETLGLNPIQNFWLFDQSKETAISYVDIQIKNNKEYTYLIYAYPIVVGSKYFYVDAPFCEPLSLTPYENLFNSDNLASMLESFDSDASAASTREQEIYDILESYDGQNLNSVRSSLIPYDVELLFTGTPGKFTLISDLGKRFYSILLNFTISKSEKMERIIKLFKQNGVSVDEKICFGNTELVFNFDQADNPMNSTTLDSAKIFQLSSFYNQIINWILDNSIYARFGTAPALSIIRSIFVEPANPTLYGLSSVDFPQGLPTLLQLIDMNLLSGDESAPPAPGTGPVFPVGNSAVGFSYRYQFGIRCVCDDNKPCKVMTKLQQANVYDLGMYTDKEQEILVNRYNQYLQARDTTAEQLILLKFLQDIFSGVSTIDITKAPQIESRAFVVDDLGIEFINETISYAADKCPKISPNKEKRLEQYLGALYDADVDVSSNAFGSEIKIVDSDISDGYGMKYKISCKCDEESLTCKKDILVVTVPDVKIYEIPYFVSSGINSDSMPIAPDVTVIPYRAINNKLLFNLNTTVGEYYLTPIGITDEEKEKLQQISISKGTDQDGRIKYGNDDNVLYYEMFRLEKHPTKWEDFAQAKITKIDVDINKSSLQTSNASSHIDDLTPNKTYFYMFRTVDFHGQISNPSYIYKITLVDTGGAVYLDISVVDLLTVKQLTFKKNINRILQISPSMSQGVVNLLKNNLYDSDGILKDSVIDSLDNNREIVLGVKEHSLWNKTFKFKITSNKTGRIIELNVRFINETLLETKKCV